MSAVWALTSGALSAVAQQTTTTPLSLAEALAAAQSYGSPVLICGSLYLAGEVLAHFGKTRSVLDLE